MVTREAAIDIYVDINLLLIAAALLWLGFRFLLKPLRLQAAYTSQLIVLKAALVSAFLVPILNRVVAVFAQSYSVPGNLSDLMVSHFVRGNLDVSSIALQQVLYMRQNITSAVTSPESIWGQVILYSFLAYAAWLSIRAVLAILHVRRVLASSYHLRGFGRLQIRVSDEIRVPFSTRSLRSQIVVIPTTMISRKNDYKIALSHELQHLRHHDVEWEIAAELIKGLFFWNPAYHYLRAAISELRELSCDQQVLRRTRLAPKDYCESLLRVCANRFSRPKLFEIHPPSVSFVETRHLMLRRNPADQLRTRINAAFDVSPFKHPKWKVFAICFVMLSACGMASYVAGKPQDWNQDQLMLSTIVNLDRLEYRNTFGTPPPR